ncbi:MAG: hypothetical protein LBQ59_03370 [Candidatus Peribacteria bacterium]|nr:hypothetical protein [Candidatus Peribacteria bacterium]
MKKDTFVNFYSFIEKEKVLSIEFFQEEENSKLEIKYLLFSRDLENINSKISAEILADNCKTNVKILSIV